LDTELTTAFHFLSYKPRMTGKTDRHRRKDCDALGGRLREGRIISRTKKADRIDWRAGRDILATHRLTAQDRLWSQTINHHRQGHPRKRAAHITNNWKAITTPQQGALPQTTLNVCASSRLINNN